MVRPSRFSASNTWGHAGPGTLLNTRSVPSAGREMPLKFLSAQAAAGRRRCDTAAGQQERTVSLAGVQCNASAAYASLERICSKCLQARTYPGLVSEVGAAAACAPPLINLANQPVCCAASDRVAINVNG